VGLNGVKPVLVRELSERRRAGGFGIPGGKSNFVATLSPGCCAAEGSADVGDVTLFPLSWSCSFSGPG